jgi:hypothetical protein
MTRLVKITVIILLSGGSMLSAAAYSQVIGEVEEPKITVIDGADIYRARHVLKRFFSNEKSPQCYRVVFGDLEGNLAVEFIPKDRDPIVYHEGEEPPLAKPPCGVNIGYVLDGRGKVLRHLYSR